MGTFSFPKSMDDVRDPELLPEDWYPVEVKKEPEISMNSTLRKAVGETAGEEEVETALEAVEKAGYNLGFTVKVIDQPDPSFNGRSFFVNLPFPTKADEEKYWATGEKASDGKMKLIARWVTGLGGSVSGDEFSLEEGSRGIVFVGQRMKQDESGFENFISIFDEVRPYDDYNESSSNSDSDVPF